MSTANFYATVKAHLKASRARIEEAQRCLEGGWIMEAEDLLAEATQEQDLMLAEMASMNAAAGKAEPLSPSELALLKSAVSGMEHGPC